MGVSRGNPRGIQCMPSGFMPEGEGKRGKRDTACFRVGSCNSVLDFLFSLTSSFFGFIDGVNHGKIV
jgi:hypothetical protein